MMIRTLCLSVLFIPSLLSESPSCRAADSTPEEGFTAIFNGKDLTDWDGDSRLWTVKEGAIRGETTPAAVANGNTFLIWTKEILRDFELRLQFRCNATNNSGIQYRSRRITDDSVSNRWVVAGYQHEVRNELKFPEVAGFIFDERGTRGRLCLVGEQTTWHADGGKTILTFLNEREYQKLFKLDAWNDVAIVAQGPRIQHSLNGRKIVDFTDLDAKRALSEGVLALQLHAGAPMWAEFRNIRLRPLP